MKFNELKPGEKFKVRDEKKLIFMKGFYESNGKPKAICLNNGHIFDIGNINILPFRDDNSHKQEKTRVIVQDYDNCGDPIYLLVNHSQLALVEKLENRGIINLTLADERFEEV